ncbi:hypothetical protein GCM10027417_23950 [Glutamicibacter endophyticus]
MILAEQFECRIPTPDALNEGVLYCSGSATNAPEIWSAMAAVVTALATLGLLAGVWAAYKQIKETREMHDDDQQLQAMGQYLSAVQYFQHVKVRTEVELLDATNRVRSSGALFRLAFRLIDVELIESLTRFENELIKFAELEFYSTGHPSFTSMTSRYSAATAALAKVGTESLSRLRSYGFRIIDMETVLLAEINKVRDKLPNSDTDWIAVRASQ